MVTPPKITTSEQGSMTHTEWPTRPISMLGSNFSDALHSFGSRLSRLKKTKFSSIEDSLQPPKIHKRFLKIMDEWQHRGHVSSAPI